MRGIAVRCYRAGAGRRASFWLAATAAQRSVDELESRTQRYGLAQVVVEPSVQQGCPLPPQAMHRYEAEALS
jgi:hypothetical protein